MVERVAAGVVDVVEPAAVGAAERVDGPGAVCRALEPDDVAGVVEDDVEVQLHARAWAAAMRGLHLDVGRSPSWDSRGVRQP
jgi:hypothetical protein